MLLRIGRLAVISAISPQDLADAFGVSRATVQRARRRYLVEGEAAFLKPRRGRGPSVFTPELAGKATALLETGMSGSAVARALGVSVASVNKWRRQGLIGEATRARERLLLDVIRMIAYRAETRMMLPVMQAQGKKTHPRKLLRALLAADADILPDPASGVLTVRIFGLGNDACDRQIDALLTELNTTGMVFSGTEMRMVYEVDGAPEPAQTVSPNISRGQEVWSYGKHRVGIHRKPPRAASFPPRPENSNVFPRVCGPEGTP